MRKYPITVRVRNGVCLEDVIKGVKGLLAYYRSLTSFEYDGVLCPLCRLVPSCEECLWRIFHHLECEDFAYKMFDEDVAALKRDTKWRAFRIKDLKSWLEELERPGVKVKEVRDEV